jgi:hypothetical protein
MTGKKRPKKIISDEEIEQTRKLLLKQIGEAAGLTTEEMEKRLRNLLRRSSVRDQDVEKVVVKALEKVKKQQRLKVTVELNEDLEQKFIILKKKFEAKSNSQLLKKLITYAFQQLRDLKELTPDTA